MTTSILEQVTELREKAQEMLDKAKELEQKAGEKEVQLWKPGIGDEYYCVMSNGSIFENINHMGKYNESFLNYNCYCSLIEAKKAAFEERITRMLKKLAKKLNSSQPECDGSYFIIYDPRCQKLSLCLTTNIDRYCGGVYCSSPAFLDKAIELIGKDALIKYCQGFNE